MNTVTEIASAARDASRTLASAPTATKDAVLLDIADQIDTHARDILSANALDMQTARGAGLPAPKLRRLELTEASISQLSRGVRQVAALTDPVGICTREYNTSPPANLHVRKVRIPLGVIAMIYEARPGVTVDAFSLCFKAGNACILKGGKEATHSNEALAAIVRRALQAHSLPDAACSVVSSLDREELKSLLELEGLIDLVIPRGGHDLIRFVAEHSRIPTIQHFQGVCHIFIDATADLERALEVCVTAKTSAPATCNAAECLLVHHAIAAAFVPKLGAALIAAGVEMRGDPAIQSLATAALAATDDDFGHEFLDLIYAAKVVSGVDEAIRHIQQYGSNHTEAILSETPASIEKFIAGVGSSCVAINASTRFNDGFQLGLGAEIGISTSKLHAYGPMGLEELTTQRFEVRGDYHTR
ncbi:MAG: glutamate-5-semialdehyde dehydrogenase [Pyrinomonadaceae bacterium]|nr:glutamate-5-semialdehyde dehydrogenase [Phycisphaerales bacterium]